MFTKMAGAEPQIRFFSGPTGHKIAYAVHGAGPALVCSAWWVSHVEEDWKQPGFRHFFRRLGEHFTVYRYDRPGAGLSDRDRHRVAPEDEVATLSALINHLDLDRYSLFGLTCSCPAALHIAARAGDRVDRLILFGSYLRGPEVAPPDVRTAMSDLVRAHWGMGAKLLTDLFDPDAEGDERKAMSAVQRASASGEMAAALLRLTFESDVSALASEVRTPAIVLHRKGDRTIPFAAGRAMAAALPNSTFQPLEGRAHVPWAGDIDAAVDAVLDFVGQASRSETTPPPNALQRRDEVWSLTFAGKTIHLKNARGLADLAILLANPHQEIAATTLLAGDAQAPSIPPPDDPVLDSAALEAFRARLRDIDATLADAGGEQADELRDERDSIAHELRSALGLGGRPRRLDPSAERARKAVSARIRSTIDKIGQALPAAGAHLHAAVKTGTYCSYGPDDAPAWDIDS